MGNKFYKSYSAEIEALRSKGVFKDIIEVSFLYQILIE